MLKTPRRIRKTLYACIVDEVTQFMYRNYFRIPKTSTDVHSKWKWRQYRDPWETSDWNPPTAQKNQKQATMGIANWKIRVLSFDPTDIRDMTERCELDNKFQSNCEIELHRANAQTWLEIDMVESKTTPNCPNCADSPRLTSKSPMALNTDRHSNRQSCWLAIVEETQF